jgi:hypothetical protein
MKERENEKIKEERKYKSLGSLLSSDNDIISAIKKILTSWNNRYHGRPLKIARLATQPTCLAWTTHTSSGLVVWVINNPNGQTFSLITFLLSHYFPSHIYFLPRSPFIPNSLLFSFYTDTCLYAFFFFFNDWYINFLCTHKFFGIINGITHHLRFHQWCTWHNKYQLSRKILSPTSLMESMTQHLMTWLSRNIFLL